MIGQAALVSTRAVDIPRTPMNDDEPTREALAVAYQAIRADLEELVPALVALGYRFQRVPLENLTESNYSTVGRRTYLEVAHEPPPLALDMWWQTVGAVDLVGDFTALIPEDTPTTAKYNNGRYLDALVVDGVEHAIRETYHQTRHGGESDGADAYVDVAPDFVHKAGYSGAGPVHFRLPAPADPVLIDDNEWWPHGLTFTEMVTVSMSWAGLPGLRTFMSVPPELDALLAHFSDRYGSNT